DRTRGSRLPRPLRPGGLRLRGALLPRAAAGVRAGLPAAGRRHNLARAPGAGRGGLPRPCDVRLAGGAARRGRRGGGDLHAGRHPQRTHRPRPRARPRRRLRQAVRPGRRRGPPFGGPRRPARARAGAVPEPALGLRLPDRPQAGGRRNPRRRRPLRVTLRAPGSRRRARRLRWRHAAGLRQPPGRPGAGPAGSGRVGLRRVAAARERAGRRRVRGPHPHRRRPVAPVGQLEPGRSGTALPGHRDRRRLREPNPDGRPGGAPARRPHPRDAGTGLGRGAGRAVGAGPPRGRRPDGADRARRVGHLLPGLRPRRPRRRTEPGRPPRRHRVHDGAGRRPPERDRGDRRPAGL
ncbi:MAG: Myo-inositol 2-dehydrogenase, partial [uncultured Blastococcus sp.]